MIGVIGVQIEVVPEKVATGFSKRADIIVISLRSDLQYLFVCDILSIFDGQIPRHAKTYADIKLKLEEMRQKRIKAIKRFHDDLTRLKFPEPYSHVKIEDEEFEKSMDGIDKI